ncbi:MAG: hypothetical protein OK452_06960 [Thaumarchaeota archaeon]|nr:hypothetical protein [Nitrososphaerota archaeon]
MKRPIVFILIFIILISLLSVPLLFLHLGPPPVSKVPRQVDPAVASAQIVYGPGLFIFYGLVISSIDAGNLSAVKAFLGQAGLLHIPSEVSDVVNTFNRLLNSTADILAATDTEILHANSSLKFGRVAEATSHVQAAMVDLRTANGTISELVSAASRLASATGIPSTLFVQKVFTIVSLYSKYVSQVHQLQNGVTGETKLIQTSVTLIVSPSSIETGSTVRANGKLTTISGAPIASRGIKIFLSNATLKEVVTNSQGQFDASFPTPFVYQQTVSLFASYQPKGNDTSAYAPSSSQSVQLSVSFVSPEAKVFVTPSVYAGLSISLNGTLTADGVPLSGYDVTLGAFGQDLSARSSRLGSFSFRTVAPASLGAGNYSLTLQTSGNATIGPLSKSIHVSVIKLDPSVTLNVPAFVIAGFGTTISGSVNDNGSSLPDATVLNVSPSPSVNTTTSASGSFTFGVTPGLALSTGNWDYTVGVYPKETWISPTRVSVSVFVINPLTLLLPALSAGFLVMVVRSRRGARHAPVVTVQRWESIQPIITGTVEARVGLAETFFSALELVERATSVTPQPEQTLREYLNGVRNVLKGLDHFEYVTLAFEAQLYGPGVASAVELRAQEAFESLRRALET